jgi:predicted O-methyltransferase YrrM
MVLEKIREKAIADNIPIMQTEGLTFMCDKLNECQASSVLEIGSAIGYSAIYMASHVEGLKIDTIERDEVRHLQAKQNVSDFNLNDRITLHFADALEFDESLLKHAPYDLLFIDAAKAQYQKFFEKYVGYVKDDGMILVDNLDFHGMIFDIEHINNRNTKQLVKKIKRFKEWILNNENYESEYYPVGDGIVLIRKKV